MIQQAFRNPLDFVNYMPLSQGYINVVLDLHMYHAFGNYWNDMAAKLQDGWATNIKAACNYASKMSAQTLDVFVGEWSLAITECQKHLTGYGVPYSPPSAPSSLCEYYNGDFETYSPEYKQFLQDYMLAQMDAFEAVNGLFFWTAKTEDNSGPEWDYLFLLRKGIAPRNLCERRRVCDGLIKK